MGRNNKFLGWGYGAWKSSFLNASPLLWCSHTLGSKVMEWSNGPVWSNDSEKAPKVAWHKLFYCKVKSEPLGSKLEAAGLRAYLWVLGRSAVYFFWVIFINKRFIYIKKETGRRFRQRSQTNAQPNSPHTPSYSGQRVHRKLPACPHHPDAGPEIICPHHLSSPSPTLLWCANL